jgi:signal transduction histidine kinase
VSVALAGCTGEETAVGGIALVAVLLGALAAGLAYLLGRAHGAAAAPQPAGAAEAPTRAQSSDAAAPALRAPALPDPEPGRNATEQDNYSFTLSHDLRAPLRVVEGFTRIVKEDYGEQLDRVGNDHLERVLGAAARMNLMIDALLALARLSQQPLSRQRVNLSQLAGFVVDDLRRGTNERVVDADIETGLSVTGDPTLLRLVLENLLGNAWKYTAKSASPRIELRRESAAGAPTLAFVVRDNGAGFDMRSADRLFGLFQRLHSASDFPGHGVGLASVRRIVERHGGRVWAESEPGRGAAFHVELPA